MLERLWSGWRSSYVDGAPRSETANAASSGVFRRILESGRADDETYIVHRGALVFAIVNIHPYTSGHVLVVPYREVADLADLTAAEGVELWATVTTAVDVVRRAYGPDGINVGLNLGRPAGGSIPDHLHVHVVPRWTGDSNFMSAIANTQTLPEALDATANRLRVAWNAVSNP